MVTDYKILGQRKNNITFIDLINEQYLEYCQIEKLQIETKSLLKFLVIHNVLRESIINRFVVLELYKEYIQDNTRAEAIKIIQKETGIEQRAIYSILANYYVYFRKNRLKFP